MPVVKCDPKRPIAWSDAGTNTGQVHSGRTLLTSFQMSGNGLINVLMALSGLNRPLSCDSLWFACPGNNVILLWFYFEMKLKWFYASCYGKNTPSTEIITKRNCKKIYVRRQRRHIILSLEHIEAETKWQPFCRRPIQMHFCLTVTCLLIQISIRYVLKR